MHFDGYLALKLRFYLGSISSISPISPCSADDGTHAFVLVVMLSMIECFAGKSNESAVAAVVWYVGVEKAVEIRCKFYESNL